MFEIELINNQPLCEIYDNDVEEILTASHLLFGGRLELTNFNNSNFNAEAPFLPYRYEHLNTILNHSWKRWTKEYLATVPDLQKFKANKVDDVVLIAYDKMPQQFWRL